MAGQRVGRKWWGWRVRILLGCLWFVVVAEQFGEQRVVVGLNWGVVGLGRLLPHRRWRKGRRRTVELFLYSVAVEEFLMSVPCFLTDRFALRQLAGADCRFEEEAWW